MLKQHATIFRRLMVIADMCIVTLAFFTGYFLRDRAEGLYPIADYLWILPVFVIMWWVLLYFGGMYASFRLKSIVDILLTIAKAAFFGLGIFGSINYLLKLQYISRTFILLIFLFGIVFLALEKLAIVLFFRHLRREGFNFRNIIIVGTGPRAQRFIQQVDKNREFGLKVYGLIDHDPSQIGKNILGHDVIGGLDDVPAILQKNPIDHVFFIVPRAMLERIEEAILYCETVGIPVSIAVDLFNLRLTTGKESSLLGLPLLTFETAPDKVWSLIIKRAIDFVISAASLILLSPVFCLIALVIRISSPGPVLFRQTRVGLNGRRFTLYKFRTMVQNAESQLESLRAMNEMEGPVFKMDNDPRLTNVGKFLRKFSLDELPQLWNVFKGDMSLVGPRPPIDYEVERYDHWQRRRLSMRPGITCFWQISGRNQIVDFDKWMKMDLEYIDSWSLGQDFKILFKTIPAVLLGIGAK